MTPKPLLAKEYLAKRPEERKIQVEVRPEWGRGGKAKYGRWLGVAYVDVENMNEELAKKRDARK